MRYIISMVLIGTAVGAAIVGILGWQGRSSHKLPMEPYSDSIMPGMDRQPKLRPQKPFAFMTNGISSQLAPAGTIARSEGISTAEGTTVYRFEMSPVNSGMVNGTTNFIETNPLPVNSELLARGHQRFDIYCAPCHSKLGDGNGITKRIGDMPAVANLHDKRIVEMTDGEIFNTITKGKGLMGAYGPIVPAEDRWAIVAYLRALQLSQLGSTDDLTPAQSATLNK
jgi:mono/diheme cytochrome c family protein